MKFGSVATRNAEGAILAHTIRLEDGALKKGQRLSAADVDRLSTAGIDAIVAEPVSDVGLGSAIMDRLRRAAFR